MARTASTNTKASLAATNTTLCLAYKVTRVDGQIFYFTDHDEDLLIDGETYSAGTAGYVSAFETSSQMSVDNAEVKGFFESTAFTKDDLNAGLWDFAEVRVMLVDWTDTTRQLKTRRGWLGEVSTFQDEFVVELRGLMQKLQQNVGRIYTALCDATIGDSRCGIDLDAITDGRVTATITSVTSNRVFTCSSLTQDADWFGGGLAEWVTGDNAGLSMEVKTFTGGQVVLQMPMPRTVAVGDSVQVTVGCRHRRTEDCSAKFDNVVNFRGFPDVPGFDRLRSGK